MLRSSLWSEHLIKLPGMKLREIIFFGLSKHCPDDSLFILFGKTLYWESKWAASFTCYPSKWNSSHIIYMLGNTLWCIYRHLIDLLLEFSVSNESATNQERACAWSTGIHFRLDSSFSSPASHIYFVPLWLKSNWSSKNTEEEIELQIELHPKVIWALKRYTAAIERLPVGAADSNSSFKSNYKIH